MWNHKLVLSIRWISVAICSAPSSLGLYDSGKRCWLLRVSLLDQGGHPTRPSLSRGLLLCSTGLELGFFIVGRGLTEKADGGPQRLLGPSRLVQRWQIFCCRNRPCSIRIPAIVISCGNRFVPVFPTFTAEILVK
ncbi:unnamed protein product [Musa acuminata subsp. malaccensis]|uniref:(wild Malaysian banana) hypothetical protein n=1 Tax=Musa acuminata subsp. malaccensis TaxID=214687 RepID=A0A804J774_MUSAM|nr:unnamed protein product [Musa acuminata subsp. malaccensis]